MMGLMNTFCLSCKDNVLYVCKIIIIINLNYMFYIPHRDASLCLLRKVKTNRLWDCVLKFIFDKKKKEWWIIFDYDITTFLNNPIYSE